MSTELKNSNNISELYMKIEDTENRENKMQLANQINELLEKPNFIYCQCMNKAVEGWVNCNEHGREIVLMDNHRNVIICENHLIEWQNQWPSLLKDFVLPEGLDKYSSEGLKQRMNKHGLRCGEIDFGDNERYLKDEIFKDFRWWV